MSQGTSIDNRDMVVSPEVQSKAALYGLAVNLVNLHNIPNRKSVKRSIKKLRKDVIKAIGNQGGESLLNGNRNGVEVYVRAIKGNKVYTKHERNEQLALVAASWMESYITGMAVAYGG